MITRRIEMALLQPSKETENKLRWSTHVEKDNTHFHLYIPKWRVPTPWPGRIYVSISPCRENTDYSLQSNPHIKNLEAKIKAIVKPYRDHTRTRRYTPIGLQSEWQIGEPYIPYSLIPPESSLLFIEVEWDLSSKGQFVNVPTYRDDPDYDY